MVSGQWMLSIWRRQPFINTCTFLMIVVVVLQFSAPYSRTDGLDVHVEDSHLDIGLQTVVLSSICSSTEGMRPLLCLS
ncbi:unnamed protein product [Schistosoma curassoni]|uniref:Neur_chan_memb domain-containing protein n=1 Tax=Schistosoma curassoni TaxID=6186 RepID=A0A183L1H7_9TREM|nr:unnamed protein product [Schistosoma curassoni]